MQKKQELRAISLRPFKSTISHKSKTKCEIAATKQSGYLIFYMPLKMYIRKKEEASSQIVAAQKLKKRRTYGSFLARKALALQMEQAVMAVKG